MRSEKAVRLEFLMDPTFREDAQVLEWLDSVPNRSAAIRAALTDYVQGSRHARAQMAIAELQREVEFLRSLITSRG